jgi:transposase
LVARWFAVAASMRYEPVFIGVLECDTKIGIDTRSGMCHYARMPISAPKDLTVARRFFLKPENPKHRQYEAIRAYYVEGLTGPEAAKKFGYTHGAFRQLCHQFICDPNPEFFITPKHGPQARPQKDPARETIIALRKQNYSVYEISDALKEGGIALSPTAVREVLREEGFSPLLRRRRQDIPEKPRPQVELVADVRSFAIPAGEFDTICGGLFLFIHDMVRLAISDLAGQAHLPGSKLIPAEHALRSCLALKLWSIERKSHVMPLVSDPGLALFAGLNAIPKKSFLSEYSSKVEHKTILRLLGAWHEHLDSEGFFAEQSFNLDFHSVPFYGEDPIIEKHYVSMRSRAQPSVLVFLAQDADNQCFCYSNADLRKGEQDNEILNFISFWKSLKGELPKHLVFDSKLTTYANLAKIDEMGIAFITLRRRSRTLLEEVSSLAPSAWRKVELDVPNRKFKTPSYFEQKVRLEGCDFRQLFVKDLGHDEPTIILTNEHTKPAKKVILRYAKRMLIENSISDAVRFFHIDALSSAVGMKVDFDMALMVLASALYRVVAQRMRGYATAEARTLFHHIINMPATISTTSDTINVQLHRRAHLPLILASGLTEQPVQVPWWGGRNLRITAK